MEPAEALRRIAYLLERDGAETYKVRAFRKAAASVDTLDSDELVRLASSGGLKSLANVGETTARVIADAVAGQIPAYLEELERPGPSRSRVRRLLSAKSSRATAIAIRIGPTGGAPS